MNNIQEFMWKDRGPKPPMIISLVGLLALIYFASTHFRLDVIGATFFLAFLITALDIKEKNDFERNTNSKWIGMVLLLTLFLIYNLFRNVLLTPKPKGGELFIYIICWMLVLSYPKYIFGLKRGN
jgi:hypothetical protein